MPANYLKKKEKNFSQPKGSIESLFQRLGWKKPLASRESLLSWQSLCEELKKEKPRIAEALINSSTALKLNDKQELVVKLKSASLANEMQFHKKDLLTKINRIQASKSLAAIKDLVFELS